jgi:hypothetical protein
LGETANEGRAAKVAKKKQQIYDFKRPVDDWRGDRGRQGPHDAQYEGAQQSRAQGDIARGQTPHTSPPLVLQIL